MMRKCLGILGVLSTILPGVITAGERPGTVYRLEILYLETPDNPMLSGLLHGLQESGYIEGKNLVLDTTPRRTLAELRAAVGTVKNNVDVVVALGGTETAIAKAALQKTPIVFLPAEDALHSGFIKSLARPETNLTGITLGLGAGIVGKCLEIYKEVVPALRRVAMFFDAREENPIHTLDFRPIRKSAARLGVQISDKPIKSITEAEREAAFLSRNTTDGIFFICSSLFTNLTKIGNTAKEKKIPLYACSSLQVAEQGGLLTYAPDLYSLGYRGAWYISRILRGTKAGDLPVETPTRYELTVNLNTAKEMGIRIPPEVLIFADKVIK